MLQSLLKKSKSLIGIGDKVEGAVIEPEIRVQEELATEALDADELEKRVDELKETVYENIRRIRDPEKPSTLEDLNVVYEEGVTVTTLRQVFVIRVEFNPTVPHCSLATLIGLCIRAKLQRCLPESGHKLDVYIKRGAHQTEDEINKQINDKERIAAAMENPNLRGLVEECIKEEE